MLWRGAELVERIAQLVAAAHRARVPVIAIQQTGPPGSPFDPADPARSGTQPGDRCPSATSQQLSLSAQQPTSVSMRPFAQRSAAGSTSISSATGTPQRPKATPTQTSMPEQIVADHNRVLSQAIHPGGRVRLIGLPMCSAMSRIEGRVRCAIDHRDAPSGPPRHRAPALRQSHSQPSTNTRSSRSINSGGGLEAASSSYEPLAEAEASWRISVRHPPGSARFPW